MKYIVGDLVQYVTTDIYRVEYCEGTSLGKNVYCLCGINSGRKSFIRECNIVPIPLTSEILEKNGWILSGDSWLLKINDDITLGILFFKDIVVCYVRATNEVTHKEHNFQRIKLGELHYLHQLQHILFGLGINPEIKV